MEVGAHSISQAPDRGLHATFARLNAALLSQAITRLPDSCPHMSEPTDEYDCQPGHDGTSADVELVNPGARYHEDRISQHGGQRTHAPSPGILYTKNPPGSCAVGRGGRCRAGSRQTICAPAARVSGIAAMPVGHRTVVISACAAACAAAAALLLALHPRTSTVWRLSDGCVKGTPHQTSV